MEVNLDKIKKVHFIGIGGIGVSAIARLMKIYGKEVTGSDLSSSTITESLTKLGIKIASAAPIRNTISNVLLFLLMSCLIP